MADVKAIHQTADALAAGSRLLAAVGIDKEPRKLERPSDHTPIWVRLTN